MRLRIEEILPMALEELPRAADGDANLPPDPAEEATLDLDDNSDVEDEAPPQPTVAEQWSQLFGNAKARAEAKAKAAAKAAGKTIEPAVDWNLETFRRVETTTKSRRAVPVTSAAPTGKPFRKGQLGPVKHPRHGLAGAVQYWACGSRENLVLLLLKLIHHFGVEANVREQLGRKEERDQATDTYMVDRAREFIQASKGCTTVEQQRQFLMALAIFAPPRAEAQDQNGMANRIAKRLGVTPGRRTKRPGEERGRQRGFDKSIDLRGVFDARLAELYVPMQMVGEEVLCRGQLGKLTKYDKATGRCEVTFTYDGVEAVVPYASRFGRGKGSARLQRPPALLLPPSRERTKDAITPETHEHVREIFELTCPTSPHQKDERKRRLVRHVYQRKQAMIQTMPLDEIYRLFQKTYPLDKLAYTQFKLLKPWNVIKAYRETCLCRCCELFRLFVQALQIVGKLLEPLVMCTDHAADADVRSPRWGCGGPASDEV